MPKLINIRTNEGWSINKNIFTIGRGEVNDIDLKTCDVSLYHCAIMKLKNGKYILHDLGSRNHTWVNDEIVYRKILEPGDRIRIGNETLIFLEESRLELIDDKPMSLSNFSPQKIDKLQVLSDERPSTILTEELTQDMNRSDFFACLLDFLHKAQTLHNSDELFLFARKKIEKVLQPDVGVLGIVYPNSEVVEKEIITRAEKKAEKVKLSKTILKNALASSFPVWTEDAWAQSDYREMSSIKGSPIRSAICVPFESLGHKGFCFIYNKTPERKFSLFDAYFLWMLCSLLGLCWDRMKIREKLEAQQWELQNNLFWETNFITRNKKMIEIIKDLESIAKSNSEVLIIGETGTGKELIARSIHFLSGAKGEFYAINCATLTGDTVNSELFGYEKGAFTGADRMKIGKIEAANDGTLFLDEIGELPLDTQAKLLRALEEKIIYRLGGIKGIPVNFRLISATNRNLAEEVKMKRFREDLFYRLNKFTINLPPLKERKEDIPLLVAYFIDQFYCPGKIEVDGITRKALELLMQYDWPGNVRELRNIIEYAVKLCSERVITEEVLLKRDELHREREILEQSINTSESLANIEKRHIEKVLYETGWNITQAAKILDITRPGLHNKIKKYNITRPSDI